jgi:hypothetical protein
MKTIKSSWKVIAAALVGFLLGAAVFHTPRASAQYGTTIKITAVPSPGSQRVSGQVVGFSCATDNGSAECFIASQ